MLSSPCRHSLAWKWDGAKLVVQTNFIEGKPKGFYLLDQHQNVFNLNVMSAVAKQNFVLQMSD